MAIGEDWGRVSSLSSNQLTGSSEMSMKELGWCAVAVDDDEEDRGEEGSSDDDDDDDDGAGGDGGKGDVCGDKGVVVRIFSDAFEREARGRFK